MNDNKKIKDFVISFRDMIETYWTPDLLWEKFNQRPNMTKSAGYCGPSSAFLREELSKAFPNESFSNAVGKVYFDSKEWIRGKHVWVVWHHKFDTATIIDITSDQSGKIDSKIIVENIDELARRGINYIPYQLARSINEVGPSLKKRVELLEERVSATR